MLDLRGDDVARPSRGGHALDAQVVRFRAPRGEDDLVLRHLEESGDLLASGVYALARLTAEAVHARGIAEALAEIGQHRLEHLGMHRRGCVVIEIDSAIPCRA